MALGVKILPQTNPEDPCMVYLPTCWLIYIYANIPYVDPMGNKQTKYIHLFGAFSEDPTHLRPC